MNKIAVVCGMALAVTALSACTQRFADTPSPTRFEASKQLKLQSASHWRAVAAEFAAQISADLRQKGINQPLYVADVKAEYPFVEGFQELLASALVAQGWDLRTTPRSALSVNVRYSVYRSSLSRKDVPIVEESVPENIQYQQYTDGPIPRTEVLVTASIVESERVLVRRSKVYFVTDEDAGLYWKKASGAVDVKVKGE